VKTIAFSAPVAPASALAAAVRSGPLVAWTSREQTIVGIGAAHELRGTGDARWYELSAGARALEVTGDAAPKFLGGAAFAPGSADRAPWTGFGDAWFVLPRWTYLHDGARAYLGVTTAGFPNLFMLYGPNTNNGSILAMIESQVEYALRQIERIVHEHLAWLDVRAEPMEQYNDEIQRAIAGVAVWQAGCTGYYRTPGGRVVTQWPHSMTEYRTRTQKPDADAYDTAPRR